MMIIHAQADRTVRDLPPGSGEGMIVLAGPVAAFDDLDLPQPAGAVGSRVLRLTLLQPWPSAFDLLAECALLFAPLLDRHPAALRYLRAGAEGDLPSAQGPVVWALDQTGAVTAVRLALDVACSPLLAPVMQDLRAAELTDDRRFEFLAAAFAGA